jgi:hypothetical protein
MTPHSSSVVAWLRQRSLGLRHLTLHVSTECVSSCHCPAAACPSNSNVASLLRVVTITTYILAACAALQLQRAHVQVPSVLAMMGLAMTQLQQLRLTTHVREPLDIVELVWLMHLSITVAA